MNWDDISRLSELNPESVIVGIPNDLGDIEFLREHPNILLRLMERSDRDDLQPFIAGRDADYRQGGFSWGQSPEGFDFWNEILREYRVNRYYEKYPI